MCVYKMTKLLRKYAQTKCNFLCKHRLQGETIFTSVAMPTFALSNTGWMEFQLRGQAKKLGAASAQYLHVVISQRLPAAALRGRCCSVPTF